MKMPGEQFLKGAVLLALCGCAHGFSLSAADIEGTVVLPGGKPAAGAQVAMTAPGHQLELGHARLEGNLQLVVIADQEGRFHFSPVPYADGIVAVNENGYAEQGLQDFTNDSKLTLQSWGCIEGVLRIGTRLGTNEEVQLGAFNSGPAIFHNSSVWKTVTDGEGRFVFTCVPPGTRGVSHGGIRERFTVKPGETNHISVGGTGRAVIGTLVIPSTATNGAEPRAGIILESLPDYRALSVKLAPDGTFRVDDVSAGTWGLEVLISRDRSNKPGAEYIGAAGRTLIIPEMPGGRSDEPLDVGTVESLIVHTPQIGEMVPSFEVKTTDGGTFKLADHRGQFVLLEFEPLPANPETRFVRTVWKKFGSDHRFAVLTLKVQPAGLYEMPVHYEEIPWPQTHLGDAPWYVQFPLRISLGLPINGDEPGNGSESSCMLLGADGKIVAENLHGDDIEAAVSQSLEKK